MSGFVFQGCVPGMKEALVILGRIPAAHVRPPLTPVSEDERHRIRLAIRAAGLLA
jgi:dihydrodipicolinate synthase/N-acetylneuraminate lyase